jgi:hypothetical protein
LELFDFSYPIYLYYLQVGEASTSRIGCEYIVKEAARSSNSSTADVLQFEERLVFIPKRLIVVEQ